LAQEDVPSAYGCSCGTRSSSLRRQVPNVVERAAVLPEVVAPRERWAKLAKRTTAELDGRPSSNRPAPKRTAPRYPRPGRPDRGPAVPPHRPDPRPVRLHRPASTPGNAAGTPPSPLMTEVHSIRHVRTPYPQRPVTPVTSGPRQISARCVKARPAGHQLSSPCRFFGEVTSRTRRHQA
jgi:hypothetical protein